MQDVFDDPQLRGIFLLQSRDGVAFMLFFGAWALCSTYRECLGSFVWTQLLVPDGARSVCERH